MEKVTVIFGRTENNYSAYIEGLDCFVCASETFEELKKMWPKASRFIRH